MKKISYKPCFKHILLEILEEKEKKETKILLPEETQLVKRFVKCKIIDYARDCLFSKNLIEGRERYAIVQGHMIEKIEVDGDVYFIASEQAIVLISYEDV